MAEEKPKRRPFHETIVDAIREAVANDMGLLARLIKTTNIPKDHDKIIAAWNQRLGEMSWGEDLSVPASLLEQKQEAAEKERIKAEKEAAAEGTTS